MNVRIGCSGFPRTKAEYYRKFPVVELSKTFYRMPSLGTAKKWSVDAPPSFEFIVRARQVITHGLESQVYTKKQKKFFSEKDDRIGLFRPTEEVFKAWHETETVAAAVKAKLILFSCPDDFAPTGENITNAKTFFKGIDRKRFVPVFEPPYSWKDEEVLRFCMDMDLVHSADPFKRKVIPSGEARYLRFSGMNGYKSKYKGWDLKLLRDFCEDLEAAYSKPVYTIFDNAYRMTDAERFAWIVANTGRTRHAGLGFFKEICRKIDVEEEDSRVERISREAEKIVALILHTDYQKVDIDIEKEKLRGLCLKFFPDKDYLYEMIYANRFERLWKQFREEEG